MTPFAEEIIEAMARGMCARSGRCACAEDKNYGLPRPKSARCTMVRRDSCAAFLAIPKIETHYPEVVAALRKKVEGT